jgi:hypothetical protein
LGWLLLQLLLALAGAHASVAMSSAVVSEVMYSDPNGILAIGGCPLIS